MKNAIQICGTGSSVGKSLIVASLCRIFLQDGHRVCPFKAQNMSLNSFVTKEGGEMGRAQVVQAEASKIEPHVDMNPILIKPTSDINAQIIVQGKPIGNISARHYQFKNYRDRLFNKVKESFGRLRKEYKIIVIEGAGSPAEINLKNNDIVNMKMAEFANAPVILVGDIDKGGVFASLIGTLELLKDKERKRIKGFIINKFRGDKKLLKNGIHFLEKKTKKVVLGVMPYFDNIRIPEEDGVVLENLNKKQPFYNQRNDLIDIAIIKLPHISNFTDFDCLNEEPDVRLHYVANRKDLDNTDVIIIPGTKNTIEDLLWIKDSGIAEQILSIINHQSNTTLIGICGGYQMLGKKISDTLHIESMKNCIDGLGILSIVTEFKKDKILSQVKAKELSSGLEVSGYEIHHGRTRDLKIYKPMFRIIKRQDKRVNHLEGIVSRDGRIWGTYIHGIFDQDNFRRHFLNRLRFKKGLPPISLDETFNLDKELDKLARLVRENIDMDFLYKIINHTR